MLLNVGQISFCGSGVPIVVTVVVFFTGLLILTRREEFYRWCIRVRSEVVKSEEFAVSFTIH
jgi:hypothetical protein